MVSKQYTNARSLQLCQWKIRTSQGLYDKNMDKNKDQIHKDKDKD